MSEVGSAGVCAPGQPQPREAMLLGFKLELDGEERAAVEANRRVKGEDGRVILAGLAAHRPAGGGVSIDGLG